MDCHSHHLRVVKFGSYEYLLVRHGAGDERMRLIATPVSLSALAGMGSNERYWVLLMVYYAHHDAADLARNKERAKWRKAAAEKRIKTRKLPAQGYIKVWIEDLPETESF